MEQQLGQAIGELQRLSASERNLIDVVMRLSTMPMQPPPPPPMRTAGSFTTYGIDTRTLGKPDTFHCEELKWPDWCVILKAYCGVVSLLMVGLMTAQETTVAPMMRPWRTLRTKRHRHSCTSSC